MEKYSLNVDSSITGGYFSSEQIDLLSIVRCQSPEELIDFINNCIQINDIYENTNIYAMIEDIGLEQAKRKVFKDYQDTMVLHDSGIVVVMINTFKHLGIKDEDIQTIIEKRSELSQSELTVWTKDFIINNYPDRSDEIFYAFQNYRSIERDQNKSDNQYEEITVLNNNLDNFDTMILGSGRIYNVLNFFYEEDEKQKRYCFDRIKKDLDFAYKNGKQVRYHSLLVQEGVDKLFEGKSSAQIKEILKNYVNESINFINEYNATHKLSVNGREVGVINSVVLFNEIVSFWKNSDGKYFNIWEGKYGITTKDIAEIFEYAREHKPEGVSFIYNEPFLEDDDRRQKVFEVLEEIDQYSPGLIDTLGSQMHITITEDENKIERCFSDFKKLQEKTGKKIQITEFDMSLGRDQAYKVFKEKHNISLAEIYDYKSKKIQAISDIINNSGVHLDGISYWSITDGIDFNLELVRSKLLKEGKIESIKEIPTVCGGLYPTHKSLIKDQELNQMLEDNQDNKIQTDSNPKTI